MSNIINETWDWLPLFRGFLVSPRYALNRGARGGAGSLGRARAADQAPEWGKGLACRLQIEGLWFSRRSSCARFAAPCVRVRSGRRACALMQYACGSPLMQCMRLARRTVRARSARCCWWWPGLRARGLPSHGSARVGLARH